MQSHWGNYSLTTDVLTQMGILSPPADDTTNTTAEILEAFGSVVSILWYCQVVCLQKKKVLANVRVLLGDSHWLTWHLPQPPWSGVPSWRQRCWLTFGKSVKRLFCVLAFRDDGGTEIEATATRHQVWHSSVWNLPLFDTLWVSDVRPVPQGGNYQSYR